MLDGLLSTLLFGFLLGIRHALEPDHVIAVSTIASQSRKLSRSTLAGVFWGIGHTATLFIIGLVLMTLKEGFSEKWALSMEFLVGIMLVYLGVMSLKREGHSHPRSVSYGKSMFIGLIHGIAGSAAMVLLTMTTVDTVGEGALYILIFGVGTVVGMLTFSTCIGIPFVFSLQHPFTHRWFMRAISVTSTAYGVYYMYNLGISEGLFRMWV